MILGSKQQDYRRERRVDMKRVRRNFGGQSRQPALCDTRGEVDSGNPGSEETPGRHAGPRGSLDERIKGDIAAVFMRVCPGTGWSVRRRTGVRFRRHA